MEGLDIGSLSLTGDWYTGLIWSSTSHGICVILVQPDVGCGTTLVGVDAVRTDFDMIRDSNLDVRGPSKELPHTNATSSLAQLEVTLYMKVTELPRSN